MSQNILNTHNEVIKNITPVTLNGSTVNLNEQQEHILITTYTQIKQLAESKKLYFTLLGSNNQLTAKKNLKAQKEVFKDYISPTDNIHIVYTSAQGSQMQGYDSRKKEWLITMNTHEYTYDALLFVGAHELAHILNDHHSIQQHIIQLTDDEIEKLEEANTGEFYRGNPYIAQGQKEILTDMTALLIADYDEEYMKSYLSFIRDGIAMHDPSSSSLLSVYIRFQSILYYFKDLFTKMPEYSTIVTFLDTYIQTIKQRANKVQYTYIEKYEQIAHNQIDNFHKQVHKNDISYR